MKTKIKSNIVPRRLVDILCFIFIVVSLPIVFIFEILVVLPAIHEPNGGLYIFTLLIALFLMYNITGNMMACMMIDTSAHSEQVKPFTHAELSDWRHCEFCNKISPPRSFHCKDCKTCILKRDHHCLFMGCCIGHKNHRYFVMFIIFLFIGSSYAFVYNSYYLWVLKARIYLHLTSLFQMLCPILLIVHGSTWNNVYLVLYNLNILALIYSTVLLLFHGPVIYHGGVCYERNKKYEYDAGFKRNMEGLFGKRMHLVWLSPVIESELPDNGFTWAKKEQ